MTPTVVDLDLRDQLSLDFTRACDQLVEARHRQRRKDTPATRATVADCATSIDAVLDVYLELYRDGAAAQ